jgi:mannose/fructose/N-acetylgalactosamine-specific phosphotransferase system component IID
MDLRIIAVCLIVIIYTVLGYHDGYREGKRSIPQCSENTKEKIIDKCYIERD